MQEQGREKLIEKYLLIGHPVTGFQKVDATKDLDQHTANTWKAAQESMKKEIALDLRESFMENDGEDSYIQLSARIVLFIRKLEKQHD